MHKEREEARGKEEGEEIASPEWLGGGHVLCYLAGRPEYQRGNKVIGEFRECHRDAGDEWSYSNGRRLTTEWK